MNGALGAALKLLVIRSHCGYFYHASSLSRSDDAGPHLHFYKTYVVARDTRKKRALSPCARRAEVVWSVISFTSNGEVINTVWPGLAAFLFCSQFYNYSPSSS